MLACGSGPRSTNLRTNKRVSKHSEAQQARTGTVQADSLSNAGMWISKNFWQQYFNATVDTMLAIISRRGI